MQRRGEGSNWFVAAHALWQQYRGQQRQDPAAMAREYQRLHDEQLLRSGVGAIENRMQSLEEASERASAVGDDSVGGEGGGDGGGDGGGGDGEDGSAGAGKKINIAETKRELRNVTDRVEELEIKTRVNQRSNHPDAVEARATLKWLQDRRVELREILESADEGEKAVVVEIPDPEEEGEGGGGEQPGKKQKKQNCVTAFTKSAFMKVVMNAINGIMAVALYFADFISDLQVWSWPHSLRVHVA